MIDQLFQPTRYPRKTPTGPRQARIAAAVIFFTVGFVALLIGALLAWGISEPVSRLSALGVSPPGRGWWGNG